MNASNVLVVLMCALVVECTGNNYRLGGCPRVTVMKSVDFDKFLGDWYVVRRFSPMATCTKITLEKGPEDTYLVNETSRPFGFNLNFRNQYTRARKLNFLRNDTSSIFRLQRNFINPTLSTFGIVDTDYENYAVVWGCDPVLFGSVQNVDILSRSPNPSDEIMEKARSVTKEMNADVSALDKVVQKNCGESTTENGEVASNEADKNTNNIVVDGP